MNKKRILLFVAFALCSVLSVMAQGERIFLFDHFAEGVIKFNTGAVNASLMNYDANNGKMYFMQGETMMELTVPEEINFGVNPTKYNTCIKSYLSNNNTSYTMNYSVKVNFNNT